MTPAEAALVLGVAASFDRRQVADEDAMAWSVALRDVSFEEGRDAVAQHYGETRDWIMPADVRRIVSTTRRLRLREDERARGPVTPPSALADNPRGEQEWVRSYRYLIARGADRDTAIQQACRRVGVQPDTGELVARPETIKAIEAARKAMSRRIEDA